MTTLMDDSEEPSVFHIMVKQIKELRKRVSNGAT